MRFLSETKHGLQEDQPGVHPNVLNRYYGVDGPTRTRSSQDTGAGHPDDEGTSDEASYQDLEDRIAGDQDPEVRHDPIDVPQHSSPFKSAETEKLFCVALRELQQQEFIPEEYGVAPAEWIGGVYPDTEMIPLGRAGREIPVKLPVTIWWPKAAAWAQGHALMFQLLEEE